MALEREGLLEGVSGLIYEEGKPFKFISKPTIINPGIEGTAILADLSLPEFDYLERHFPAGKHITPGASLLEPMGEIAGATLASSPNFDFRNRIGLLAGSNNLKYRQILLRWERPLLIASEGRLRPNGFGAAKVKVMLGESVAAEAEVYVWFKSKGEVSRGLEGRILAP